MKNKRGSNRHFWNKYSNIYRSDMSGSQKGIATVKLSGKLLTPVPVYLALIALSIVFIIPFFYMLGHSVMSVDDILNPNIKWLPRSFQINNYKYAFDALQYWYYLVRTIVIVGLSVLGQILTCSFVAYGLARVKFRLNGFIFALVILLLIVPPQTTIIPSYIMVAHLGLQNSYIPIVIKCFFAMGLNGGLIIFIFRQFFRTMPQELENAALIDGTGVFGAYFRIIFPNAKPAILITSILALVWQWNNSFEPSVFIQDASKGTLTLQLQMIQGRLSGMYTSINYNIGIDLAATFLTILPLLIVFFALQRYFMQSLTNSGLAN